MFLCQCFCSIPLGTVSFEKQFHLIHLADSFIYKGGTKIVHWSTADLVLRVLAKNHLFYLTRILMRFTGLCHMTRESVIFLWVWVTSGESVCLWLALWHAVAFWLVPQCVKRFPHGWEQSSTGSEQSNQSEEKKETKTTSSVPWDKWLHETTT